VSLRPGDGSGAPALLRGVLEAMTCAAPVRGEGCPHCGWTEERARAEALFGCPLCYQAIGWPLDEAPQGAENAG
jgi:protein-arginine kinase activator protein McsA